jgi:hypothetical protein
VFDGALVTELHAALKWCEEAGDGRTAGPIAHALICAAYYGGGGPSDESEVHQRLSGLEIGDRWRRRIETWKAVDRLGAGSPGPAADLAGRWLSEARRSGDRAAERRLLGVLGAAARLAGDMDEARIRFVEQVEVARELEDPRHLGRALLALATCLDDPRPPLEDAVRCLRARHDPLFLAKALALLAPCEARPEVAEQIMRVAIERAVAFGNVRSEGMRRLALARILQATDRPEAARRESRAAARCARQVDDLATLRLVGRFVSSTPWGTDSSVAWLARGPLPVAFAS